MNPFDFLDSVSATTKHDNPVPKNILGYIDHDFDVAKFPQETPRVIIDGRGLSNKGYSCLGNYLPQPGDRVVLMPVSTDFVILGALNKGYTPPVVPGTCVFSAKRASAQSTGSSGSEILWDTILWDPYDFLGGASSSDRIVPNLSGEYLITSFAGVDNNQDDGGREGYMFLRLGLNGDSTKSRQIRAYTPSNEIGADLSYVGRLDGASDYVSLLMGFNAGTPTTSTDTHYMPQLNLVYLGPGYPYFREPGFFE